MGAMIFYGSNLGRPTVDLLNFSHSLNYPKKVSAVIHPKSLTTFRAPGQRWALTEGPSYVTQMLLISTPHICNLIVTTLSAKVKTDLASLQFSITF